jgi:formamidase
MGVFLMLLALPSSAAVIVGGSGSRCSEDPACINRLHPDIPMVAHVAAGEPVVFIGRDASDLHLDPDEYSSAAESPREGLGIVHPLTGPVYIEGAVRGDVLAVTILAFKPGKVGWTYASPGGFGGDQVNTGQRFIVWRLNEQYAESDALPGVRIPNASFPGVVTTMPGPLELETMLSREQQLEDSGGAVLLPDPHLAEPSSLCGPEGSKAQECLRTIPPREHGGNMDIRYISTGATVYLPCFVDGCGLALGDFHYAQGDGEVSGTAIEMDGEITITTRIVKDGPELAIPSTRFYATTGFPLKAESDVPRDIAYLASSKVAALSNLSKDVNLAAVNALVSMIDYIVAEYGYDRTQAYLIASVAVDLRIGQLVDVPNVGVTAILPLDIFSQ